MKQCYNCDNCDNTVEDETIGWCKKCCIGECLKNGPCDDYHNNVPDTNTDEEDDCACQNWLGLYKNPLDKHLETCQKCIVDKGQIYNISDCPNKTPL